MLVHVTRTTVNWTSAMGIQILHNARIHTMLPGAQAATAIAFEVGQVSRHISGRLLAIGTDDQILAELGDRAHIQNLDGKTILPGLTDAHIHLEQYAFSLQKVDCATATLQECLDRVTARARVTAPGRWILGHGWNQNDWPEGFGDAAILDAVAPQHPVYLTAKSLHAAWVNTSALDAAGVSAETPDPHGGRIQRDDRGLPTGILFETAMQLVSGAIPSPSTSEVSTAIRSALPSLWEAGITGIHDFDRRSCFVALQELHARGELWLRVLKSIPLEDLDYAVRLGVRSGLGDDFLRIGAVKAFADGALGPKTAAMIQPYLGEPENRGILLLDAEELYEHGCLATSNGLHLAVHAIGDRANHEVLNAFEQIRAFEREKGLPGRRHRIEHVQVIHGDDLHRLAALDIVASMQPIHATSDMLAADRFWGERSKLAYAWRALLDLDTTLAFGSDAPVDSPNPFWGLHAAITRRRSDGTPGPDGWIPEQRIRLSEALKAYTHGPAYLAGLEDRLGNLAPGALADLVVLDADPFTCEPEALRNLRPAATIIGGETVFNQAQ